MNEQEKQYLIETLIAIRSDGITLEKRVAVITNAPEGVQYNLNVCISKLTAFDAAISMAIDELREY